MTTYEVIQQERARTFTRDGVSDEELRLVRAGALARTERVRRRPIDERRSAIQRALEALDGPTVFDSMVETHGDPFADQ